MAGVPGFEPGLSVLETDVLTVDTIPLQLPIGCDFSRSSALIGYFVSLCSVCLRQRRQNFLNSSRSSSSSCSWSSRNCGSCNHRTAAQCYLSHNHSVSIAIQLQIAPGLHIEQSELNSVSYSTHMSETVPAPTVRPPSRIAKRSPFSIAIGAINSISIAMLSPGITISTPSGRCATPVTSVVRK